MRNFIGWFFFPLSISKSDTKPERVLVKGTSMFIIQLIMLRAFVLKTDDNILSFPKEQ